MDRDHAVVRVLRLSVALIALAALVHNTIASVNHDPGSDTVADLFSYFTIQSNVALVVVFTVGAIAGSRLPPWWDDLRGAVTFYLVMTGLVYAFVIADIDELLRWDVGWTNLVMHRLTPVAVVVDWVVVRSTRRPGWLRPVVWLIYPVLYLAYTWIRGAVVNWYPYDFLDPTTDSGWAGALQMTGIVLVAFLAFAVVIHVLGVYRAAGRISTTPDQ